VFRHILPDGRFERDNVGDARPEEARGYGRGVSAAFLVPVGDDTNRWCVRDQLGELVSPLPGTRRVAGGDGARVLDRVHVLLRPRRCRSVRRA